MTRRTFVSAAAAATALSAASHPVRLGGPIFLKPDDPAELAREHRRLGYSAAYCPNVKLEDARDAGERINLVGYAPAVPARKPVPSRARPVKAGSDLVLEMHYPTDGKPATDQTKVGIIFAR